MLDKEALSALFDVGVAAAAQPDGAEVNGTPAYLVPAGYQLQLLHAERSAPVRKKASVELQDLDSFIEYWNLYHDERSRIFAECSAATCQVRAIFDYHGVGEAPPAWCDHRAHYNCPQSVEWATWMGKNGKPFTQVEFAEFIENNLPDINTPPGAAMLEVARELSAKSEVNFASAVRLANGQTQFTYQEETKATVGKGKLDVPEEFIIQIPVHLGGPVYKVTARLRYRIVEGKLKFWYDLLRAHKVLEQAQEAILGQLRERTKSVVLKGKP